MTYELFTASIEAKGTPLVVLVVTTNGVGMQACEPMLDLDPVDQERVMAAIPAALREFAGRLERGIQD